MSERRLCPVCEGMDPECPHGGLWPEEIPEPVPSPEALDLRHAGHARILTEAEIREIEAERGHRL